MLNPARNQKKIILFFGRLKIFANWLDPEMPELLIRGAILHRKGEVWVVSCLFFPCSYTLDASVYAFRCTSSARSIFFGYCGIFEQFDVRLVVSAQWQTALCGGWPCIRLVYSGPVRTTAVHVRASSDEASKYGELLR
jgi:hypothetical protein